jgi:pyruvate dehydrogenase E2 component (dihydrolipoamide acetyltransferase)
MEEDVRSLHLGSPRVSPLARKHLAEGWEVRGAGSGFNHAILARDLGEPPIRMSKIRETTARRMRESLSTTAQYTLNSVADATGLLSLRAKVKAARASAATLPDININDAVMFATVKALQVMPELNAELIDGKIYRRSEIHLGFACDTEKGLLVPVVRNCEKISIGELSERVKELNARAQQGALTADDMAGATFTVSNLGNLGITSFTPILNPPQVAILGVDAIEPRPVRRKSRVVHVDHIGLSLTCDHQVIDGAPGARFLKVLREQIEKIESIADWKP